MTMKPPEKPGSRWSGFLCGSKVKWKLLCSAALVAVVSAVSVAWPSSMPLLPLVSTLLQSLGVLPEMK